MGALLNTSGYDDQLNLFHDHPNLKFTQAGGQTLESTRELELAMRYDLLPGLHLSISL